MIEQADAVVIGSGALGGAVAWHLVAAGLAVAMLDRGAIGGQTSPRAAGLSAVLRPSALMTTIAARGVSKLLGFEAETGVALTVHRSGSLKLARSERLARQLMVERERAREFGVPVETLTAAAAERLMPFLRAGAAAAITYYPDDVHLDPAALTTAYAEAARRAGCTLLPDTEAEQVLVEDGRVVGVRTPGGTIRTPIVVDAAGAWLRAVQGAEALPIRPVRHQLMITAPIDGVRDDQPITRVLDANVYVRPCDGGLMLGGYEEDPLLLDAVPPTLDAVPFDATVVSRLARSVEPEFPVIAAATPRIVRGGLPTMTVDDEHVVGPVPDCPGLHVIGGCNVGGLSTAPALGEALATMITAPDRVGEWAPLLPARFAGRRWDADAVARACRDHYAQHYWSAAARATG